MNSSVTSTESPLGSTEPMSAPDPGASSDAIFGRLKSAAFHELVSAALAEDPDAIGTLFVWIHPAIIRYCRARIGRTGAAYSSADDVAQEVCLAVLGALPRYDDEPASFLPFVYGIAAHKVADHYRRAGRDKAEPAADVPDGIDLEATPEQQTVRADVRARLVRLLDTLAPRQREILVLRLVVGLSAQETAVAIGLTATAVRVAQHRALAKLRANLAASEWL
ncbi:MAG TPA: RNA polymerase sigma factor ShbA [Actinophytocola sp.]|nr:RNA polymerase sigma factor ShbA [Actinophytocola sp.]